MLRQVLKIPSQPVSNPLLRFPTHESAANLHQADIMENECLTFTMDASKKK